MTTSPATPTPPVPVIVQQDGAWDWQRCYCGIAGHGFDTEADALADYTQHLSERYHCAVRGTEDEMVLAD